MDPQIRFSTSRSTGRAEIKAAEARSRIGVVRSMMNCWICLIVLSFCCVDLYEVFWDLIKG